MFIRMIIKTWKGARPVKQLRFLILLPKFCKHSYINQEKPPSLHDFHEYSIDFDVFHSCIYLSVIEELKQIPYHAHFRFDNLLFQRKFIVVEQNLFYFYTSSSWN